MIDTVCCRHYTPREIAEAMAEICDRGPSVVLDPAAGDGALLVAFATRFPRAQMLAMDIDKNAAERLRRKLPNCVVSVCDALVRRSAGRSRVWNFRDRVDVVVANPPFGDRRTAMVLTVDAWGEQIRCGLAAAHVLSAAACFSPKKMIVVVPDSLLHSERDAEAVRLLKGRYMVSVTQSLGSRAFVGTGASVSLIQLDRKEGRCEEESCERKTFTRLEAGVVEIVRGGVPMHEVEETAEGGRPLLHTTNLLRTGTCRIVKPSTRGLISGPVILLPRVGLPTKRHLIPANLNEHQLSDCVIAIRCQSDEMAMVVSRHLCTHFEQFRSCWRGTGAQYTTLRKLRDCLNDLDISAQVNSPFGNASSFNGEGTRDRRGSPHSIGMF